MAKAPKIDKKISAEQIKSEVEKIAEYISQAKVEIASITLTGEQSSTDKNIAHAAMELTEVIRHTEEATNTIMDKADAIMAIAGGLEDAAIGGQISEHAMGVLEACSFQDITGQRIKKVLKTLEQVELRIGNLVKLFGGHLPEGYKVGEIETTPRRPDEDLLNGPQLGGPPKQDDIDKLFASS